VSTAPLDPFDAPARPPAVPATPLPQVPGYEVLELLGRGGVGRVYKARHLGMGRVVALKMLLAAADGELLARFRTEVVAVAGLQHPHIAQVFEAGSAAGQPFYTLEYLEGGSLAQRAGGRPHRPARPPPSSRRSPAPSTTATSAASSTAT
jgi:serine/threonine protein kinase